MIGKRVSHYRILEKLGRGGMGIVYKAEDTRLKRMVALKFLPPELTLDEAAKTRFVHEAQAASALQHNNICTIHEIDETPDGRMFISMDCYDGQALSERLSAGRMPLNEALDVAAQVAEGLSKAHAANVVHRDLKPANIMVTSDGVAKILDFGLAKLTGQTTLTRVGTTVGTTAHMSPEQAKGEPADARSDIFSLGTVLYEMVTGQLPFPGEHEAAVIYGIMNTEAKPLSAHVKGVPEALQRIVDKALAKEPAARYQRALEMRDDLLAMRNAMSGKATPVGPSTLVGASDSAPGPAGRTERPRMAHALAVMDFRDLATPDDPSLSAGITELVNIGLIEANPVRVISSEYLHGLRRRLFGSARGPIEDDQIIEVARQAGATTYLAGRIGKLADAHFVTWRLVDAGSGESMAAGRVEGAKLTQVADRIIVEIVPVLARVSGGATPKTPVPVESVTTESPRAYQHYVSSLLAGEESRTDDAVRELKRAVSLDPTFAAAYLQLAGVHWGIGFHDRQAASEYAEKARALRSKLGVMDSMRLDALRYDLDNRPEETIRALRSMLERFPDDRDTIWELQSRLFFRWHFAETVDVAESGARLYPDDLQICGPVYVKSLVWANRVQDALIAARSYAEKHPDVANAWDLLADAYEAMGRSDEARSACLKALELDPNWPTLIYWAYYNGDLRGAISGLEKFSERKDLTIQRRRELTLTSGAIPSLCWLYVQAGRYRRTLEVCRAYMAPPGDPTAARWVGLWLAAVGCADEALKVADQLAREEDRYNRYAAARLRGRVLAALGDAEGAGAVAEELSGPEFAIDPHARHTTLYINATAALSTNRPERALDVLSQMRREINPFGGSLDVEMREGVARAYRMLGRLDDAVAEHVELLRLYGGHAVSHYELGRLYEEKGSPGQAAREYSKFLEMWADADEGLPQLEYARTRLAALNAGRRPDDLGSGTR